MAHLTYEQFKTETINSIKYYLPEEYQDYNMAFQMIQKAGYEYEALLIEPKNKKGKMIVTPLLNMTEAFKKYEAGTDFDTLMYKLADIRTNSVLPSSFNEKDVLDFEKIRNKIYPRLINTASNKEYLNGKPHKSILDLSVMYTIRISKGIDDYAAVAIITDELLGKWNIAEQDLYETAMKNLADNPPFFANIADILFNNDANIEIEDIDPNKYDIPFFVLSNKMKTKGAIMAVNPAVMDRITEKLGKVYIIPSSVDETIITPQSAVEDVQFLFQMVKDVNAKEVLPEDQLSDNIYEYDIDSHSLKLVV